MSDPWVGEAVERMMREVAERHHREELELARNKKIAAQAPFLFGDLVSLIQRRVDALNKALKERGIAAVFVVIPKSPEKILVRKERLADVALELTLNLEAQVIEAVITKELREGGMPPQDKHRLSLQVGPDGQVVLKKGERIMYVEEAAGWLLDFVISL